MFVLFRLEKVIILRWCRRWSLILRFCCCHKRMQYTVRLRSTSKWGWLDGECEKCYAGANAVCIIIVFPPRELNLVCGMRFRCAVRFLHFHKSKSSNSLIVSRLESVTVIWVSLATFTWDLFEIKMINRNTYENRWMDATVCLWEAERREKEHIRRDLYIVIAWHAPCTTLPAARRPHSSSQICIYWTPKPKSRWVMHETADAFRRESLCCWPFLFCLFFYRQTNSVCVRSASRFFSLSTLFSINYAWVPISSREWMDWEYIRKFAQQIAIYANNETRTWNILFLVAHSTQCVGQFLNWHQRTKQREMGTMLKRTFTSSIPSIQYKSTIYFWTDFGCHPI